jgi:hypothetical protein
VLGPWSHKTLRIVNSASVGRLVFCFMGVSPFNMTKSFVILTKCFVIVKNDFDVAIKAGFQACGLAAASSWNRPAERRNQPHPALEIGGCSF